MVSEHALHDWCSAFFAIGYFSLLSLRAAVAFLSFTQTAMFSLSFLSDLFNRVFDVASSPDLIVPSGLEQITVS